jgi:hypothetical protein
MEATMSEHAHDNERTDIEATERADLDVQYDRLMEEINILRLESALFCFDPREARRRSGSLTVELPLGELGRQPVSVRIHPDFGQPSVLAYKVLQAIFLKLAADGCQPTEDGRCFYREKISFSWRELARLAGRSSWGRITSRELYHAIKQLQSTELTCAIYDKDTGEWMAAEFSVIARALFAGKGKEIKQCVLELDAGIVRSINRKHFAFFNLHRLNDLDTLGVVLYKRIFFHFSSINQKDTPKHALRLEKDYEDMCREWLGGLKPERYKSLIISNQLGRHLEALKRSRLIRKYDIREKATGDGFKLVFYPGEGFFDDYREYYLRAQVPKAALPLVEGIRDIQAPLELVAEFHRRLGHSHEHFEEKETAYAAELLKDLSDAEVRDLIEYAGRMRGRLGLPSVCAGSAHSEITLSAGKPSVAVVLRARARPLPLLSVPTATSTASFSLWMPRAIWGSTHARTISSASTPSKRSGDCAASEVWITRLKAGVSSGRVGALREESGVFDKSQWGV